jgi:hypothetical protein
MVVERKADQEKREAERKAHQEDLQKMMKEMMDANQTKTDDNQEGMDINLKKVSEEIKSGQAEMKFTVNAFQEKMDTLIANRKDDQKETTFCQETMEARQECEEPISADIKACQETTACHEVTETDTEKIEPDPGMMQSIEDHQKIPKGEAAVMPVRGLKKQHRVRNLVAERPQKLKERTRGYCGSRKVTIACRRTTCCVGVAWLRRNVRKDWTRNQAEQETPK